MQRGLVIVAAVLTGFVGGAVASEPDSDLSRLDLATLMSMDVQITSAAKRAQASADAAAAVFVITREDIRRSGATSVPELLRMVPGVEVARASNSRWAVTARGFNSRFANKLLVLVDGRSIYTSLYSGVSWEEQHVPLGEIERIEVVRGPGGALWGANAMNGIINIVTREASEGSGLAIAGGTGNDERNAASVHFGGTGGLDGNYRLYAENFERDSFTPGASPWRSRQAGWHWDRAAGGGKLRFLGDVRHNDLGDFFYGSTSFEPTEVSSANVTLGWQGNLHGGQLDVRGSGAWRQSDKYGIEADEKQHRFGIDAQYNAARRGRHLLSFGVALKLLDDRVAGFPGIITSSLPETSQLIWGLSVQDEVFFLDDALRLIFGAKIEGFEFTDNELQPTLRAIWRVNDSHTLWGAASRAVRTPSLFELYTRLSLFQLPGAPDGPPLSFEVFGNPHLDEEQLDAYEFGWRWRPVDRFSVDVALYAHEYNSLFEALADSPFFDPGPPGVLVMPYTFRNSISGHTRGAEIASDWIVTNRLRLKFGATLLDMSEAGTRDALIAVGGADPSHVLTARAQLDLPHRTELDIGWRRVGAIDRYALDVYDSVDLRLGWHATDSLQLSAAVDNLFDSRHVEYYDEESGRAGDVLGRSVFARFTWQPGSGRAGEK